ncbi:hypothetical protein FVEN_g9130 [Fusarium venenatum]|uniref:Fucose-specific lectin n=1 Tax=Fusarium venenatum TaxID=56646 RepID=A0A2L2T7M7_9HYPO|nr:uncharacterized protein FVRRES_00335 [Fusarium venenatum]KAG8352858.1 hypothetical protein FVEN_g9130 [Fusarium venenatum]KAH7006413.1 hypothetical protein EDB82DRAFT_493516 [Fusarium venenatum]CEI63823.1 unnamed protein product [Fusarium venenatum]
MSPHQRHWLTLPWLLLAAWTQPCHSSALYAYATDRTTQVGIQDVSTGKIYYSNCNSEDTPIFPLDKPNVLDTENKPRNGTALAAVGWWDTQKIIASIFWQAEDSVIVNGYYECDMDTGKLNKVGEYTISLTAEVDSVHAESGLAVDLLGGGEDDGYRVFYHNADKQIMMMSYTDNTNWIDGGIVSQDTAEGIAIGTVWYDEKNSKNMTVAFPKGSDNIETSRLHSTGKWKLAAFPQELASNYTNATVPTKIRMSSETADFSLPGWNASIEAIGMATDRSKTRSLFYLGEDNVLREAIAIQNNWQMAPNRSESIWPLSDDPSAGLAVTYQQSRGMTWIYYWSNGTIIQAHKNITNEWEDFTVLPQTVPKNETESGNKDDAAKEDDTATESTGLTTGAKAGLGVGVAAGVIAVGALVWFFMKRRNKHTAVPQKEENTVPEAAGTPITSPPPMYEKDTYRVGDATSPSELNGHGQPAELDNPSVVYEMPGDHTR